MGCTPLESMTLEVDLCHATCNMPILHVTAFIYRYLDIIWRRGLQSPNPQAHKALSYKHSPFFRKVQIDIFTNVKPVHRVKMGKGTSSKGCRIQFKLRAGASFLFACVYKCWFQPQCLHGSCRAVFLRCWTGQYSPQRRQKAPTCAQIQSCIEGCAPQPHQPSINL